MAACSDLRDSCGCGRNNDVTSPTAPCTVVSVRRVQGGFIISGTTESDWGTEEYVATDPFSAILHVFALIEG